jgi:tRNA1(Val) A37 N6-methylase TrmN6
VSDATQEWIGLRQAADALGISPATLKNWVRFGEVAPRPGGGPLAFHRQEITRVKTALAQGQGGRLTRRANKARATARYLPREALANAAQAQLLAPLLRFVLEQRLEVEAALYALAWNWLNIRELATAPAPGLDPGVLAHPQIRAEMTAWHAALAGELQQAHYLTLAGMPIADTGDVLGVLYQALQLAGKKSVNGAWYTPATIVAQVMSDHLNGDCTVLDPCCGSGQFLLAAIDRLAALGVGQIHERVCGMDRDPLAVRIARLNVLVRLAGEAPFEPRIYCGDSLLDLPERFDHSFGLVATNPPWGAHYPVAACEQLDDGYRVIGSRESFALFLEAGRRMLAPGGILTYILPQAFLNVRRHQALRQHLLRYLKVVRIVALERVFSGVFTPVIRVDMERPAAGAGGAANHIVLDDSAWIPGLGALDRQILDKVYALPHTTLEGQAHFALGIVTGNNAAFLSTVCQPGMEGILKGSDIQPYCVSAPQQFIRFEPARLQQVAPVASYRAPAKLVYRFIGKRLVFAYDDRQYLTLNSANILVPAVPGYPIKLVLALLNSSVYQFIFQRRFHSIKILRSHLEALPLPHMSPGLQQAICDRIGRLLQANAPARTLLHQEIGQLVAQAFSLTPEEAAYIRQVVGD